MYEPLDYITQHEPKRKKIWRLLSGQRVVLLLLIASVLIACIFWATANPGTAVRLREASLALLEVFAILFAIFVVTMLLIWLSTANPHLQILPFDSTLGKDHQLGTPVAYSLSVQLQRIADIHSLTIPGIQSERLGTVAPDSPGTEQLREIISNAMTIGLGQTTFSVGRFLVMLKELWPFGASDTILTGSIHRYGSELHIVAHLKSRRVYAWEVSRDTQDFGSLTDMIEDLSYQIARDISQVTINAQTWEGLKCLTKARYHCYRYIQTEENEYLTHAAANCFEALPFEKSNSMLADLLNKIGALYAKKDNYIKSEKIFRKATKLLSTKDDQSRSFLGLAHALIGLYRYNEALEAYGSVIKMLQG